MNSTHTFTVRHLREGDLLSHELLDKWSVLHLDHQWVWVVEHDGAIDALLIASPMHGILFLLRVAAHKGAPKTWLLTLLRTVMKECKDKGIEGFPTWVFPDGTRVSGEQTPEELAEATGCALPDQP